MKRVMRWEVLVLASLVALLIAVAGLIWAAVFYSDMLRDGALAVKYDPARVVAVADGQVTIRFDPTPRAHARWTKSGVWGLDWR